MSKMHIQATLHHRQAIDGKKKGWTRYYRDITTASSKAIMLLIADGYVGDVIEFVLVTNQMQIGAMKMTADGKVITTWDVDKAKELIDQVKSEQDRHQASKIAKAKKHR